MLFTQYSSLLERQQTEALDRVEVHIIDNVPHAYQAVTLERIRTDITNVFCELRRSLHLLEEGVLRTVGRRD